MFNPERLVLARMRRRLTSKELAEKVNVSPVTITRIEKGNNPPDKSTIDRIVSELNFPEDFFYGDDIDQLTKESASFRSLTSMTAKERNAALSAGVIAYLVSDWVSDRFNLPSVDLLDLSHEGGDPAVAARSLRETWGLGEKPISNMIHLLESKGIKVFSLSENTKNVDAFSCWRNDVPYIFLNTFKSAEHSRFDAAHELGHIVLHKHGGPHQGKEAEREANSFASSFLMPKMDVISKIPVVTSINQIIKAKKRWRVSVAALVYRLHKLNILTDWQYRTFCIQMNKRGYRTSEPNGIAAEKSLVWTKVFRILWSKKVTKTEIADEINIPLDELENLVFGLVASSESKVPANNFDNKTFLRIV